MPTRAKSPSVPGDSYLELVRRFPLKAIKSDHEHTSAVDVIGELLGRKLDPGAADYLDALVLLVNAYEDQYHTPMGSDLSPRQALRAIMEANGMTQADIGKIVGSESAVSMFLGGERELSKAQIKALVERFRLDAALFL